jgi:hypothetical protein
MTRVTVNLSKQREAAVAASGKTLIELIDLGLEAVEQARLVKTLFPEPRYRPVRPGERPALDRNREPLTPANCKHPRARRAKGLCMACGTNVGDA